MKKIKALVKRPVPRDAAVLSRAFHFLQDMIVLLRAFDGKGAYRETEQLCAHKLDRRLRDAERVIYRRRSPGKGAARSARSAKNGEIGAGGSHPLGSSLSATAAEGCADGARRSPEKGKTEKGDPEK